MISDTQFEAIDDRAASQLLISVTRQGPHDTSTRLTLQSARLHSTVAAVKHHDTPDTITYHTTKRSRCWMKCNSLDLIVDVRSLVIKLDILLFVKLFGMFHYVF